MLVLCALPLIGAIALTCTFDAAARLGRPYPGFFLWANNFVPAIGIGDAAASRAGLRYQSHLLSMNGATVSDRAAVERVIRNHVPGSPVRYTFAKAGEVFTVELPAQRLGVWTFALTLGNYLLNGLILLALGIAVIFLEPASRGARIFFLFTSNYGLYLFTSTDLVGAGRFEELYFFLLALAPATALHMVVAFPAMPAEISGMRRFSAAGYSIALVLGAASVVAFHTSLAVLLILDQITHVLWGAAFLTAFVLVLRAFGRATSPAAGQQLKIFLGGLIGAALVPAVALLTVYVAGAQVPLNYLTLGFAIFPAAIAYAIARHDLFGVDRIIRRTVGYVVVTAVILLIYAALLAFIDYVILPDMYASPAVHGLVTMLLVVVFNPLRSRIQALIDYLYFRAPYDYRSTVAAASRALASILDVDTLVTRLTGIITDQMQVTRADVWLLDKARAAYVGTDGARPLAADAPLVRYLALPSTRTLHIAIGRMSGRVSNEVLTDMVAIDAVLAIPMHFEQRLVGFLALDEKESGRFYSTEDLELLTTLASQAAVALENAWAYHALAETNRELREARDQLVEAERLAAIGELSAAVAHGIRNPVASIKAAAELAASEAPPGHPLRESFTDILGEADALEARISELLDFARPFEPNHAPADLNQIVHGALHLLRRQISGRDITVDVALAPALPGHEMDAAQIEQVCLALLTNAIEAMTDGGVLTVTTDLLRLDEARPPVAGTSDSEPLLDIRVKDTGQGIPADQLGNVFRLFYTRKARGTGVGLATVKRIVEGHHGVITVESESGRGTEFRILLPLTGSGRVPPPFATGTHVLM